MGHPSGCAAGEEKKQIPPLRCGMTRKVLGDDGKGAGGWKCKKEPTFLRRDVGSCICEAIGSLVIRRS